MQCNCAGCAHKDPQFRKDYKMYTEEIDIFLSHLIVEAQKDKKEKALQYAFLELVYEIIDEIMGESNQINSQIRNSIKEKAESTEH